MQLKTVSSIGLAFLLVFGVVGVASAQEVAATQGILIRVDSPASNTWVAIGDSIQIRILAYEDRLGENFYVSLVDSAVSDRSVNEGVHYTVQYKGTDITGTEGVYIRKGSGDAGVDTFTVRFRVVSTDNVETVDNRAVKVLVELGDESPLDNLMTDKKITPVTYGFGATLVGDGVRFGIDANRPVNGDVFKRFAIDPAGLLVTMVGGTGADSSHIDTVKFKIGDEIVFDLGLNTAEVLSAGASSIQIGVVEEDSVGTTPPINLTLSGDKMYSPMPSASAILEAGDFGDNQRVRIFAVLRDVAGNAGAGDVNKATPDTINAVYYDKTPTDEDAIFTSASDVTFIADGTAPAITLNYPIPDSMQDRISAAITDTLEGYKPLPGELHGKNVFTLNPLKFDVSETPGMVTIAHGDSTLTNQALDTMIVADFTGFAWDAAGGVQADLKITVQDSLGNESSTTLTGIWLDGKKPTIKDLFPMASNAPTNPDNGDIPTINLASKDPVFSIDEELDSLSVRYIESGGGKAIVQNYGSGNDRLETVGELVTWPVNDTTFIERAKYDLQILAIDLAGNPTVQDGGKLTFMKEFMNPSGDMFKIVDQPDQSDKVVAGVDFTMRVSVLDTMLSRVEGADVLAVTYRQAAALAVIVPADQAAALEGVTFGGTGVSAAPTFALPADLAAAGMVAKAAVLNADGWAAGMRDVTFKSTKPLTGATVMAAEGSIDPATGAYSLRITGQLDASVTVEVAQVEKFVLTAMDPIVTSTVAGPFTINVTPADEFGNPSMKMTNTTGAETYTSVAVTFATSNIAVTVPTGQQMVMAGGTDFGALAADLDGTATITVRAVETADADGDIIMGSVSVNAKSEGGPGPDPGAPAAVASIAVEDYMGADGQGDQGGLVMISFPNSSQHESVIAYQIERQIQVTQDLDEDGNLMDLAEPVTKWVAWTSIGFGADSGDNMGDANGDMQRAVVPALDNVATNWAVRSVGTDGTTSDMTTASKRVFTKESVQQTLALLGMAPEAVLTDEELADQFNAPEDYVKSIIGDRKGVVFLPVNPDVGALMGRASVPSNIRTAAGNLRLSVRTATDEPVAAVDNIAPAAVTGASGDGVGGVVLNWTASADEGMVDAIPYRGYNVPILGVKGYKVMRGASAENLEMVATLAPGSTQFTDDNLPDGATSMVYRIDAYDDNNVTMGQAITVANISIRVKFVDADGDPVYLMVLPSKGGTLDNDFEDFVTFAAAFNSQKGDANYNPQADVDDDGTVDFADFVTAASTFGNTAVVPAGSKLAVVPQRPGVNADTEMTLELTGEKVLVGETISLTVSMANARALNGYGLELAYDADKFEFVSAAPAENDLLKSEGGETPLFKNWPEEGRVSVVNAIIESGSVSGEGALVTFTFKVLSEFEDNARFEIARGVVFDPDQLQNPVVTLGALDVQSTPTEFALHQNYPNPFNPQTNIPYDLAEGGDVVLRIYNLLGQEVRTLVRERQAPGRYTVQWSGMDDRGVTVSSGIYFYQVSVAGKFQDAKRLMLLK